MVGQQAEGCGPRKAQEGPGMSDARFSELAQDPVALVAECLRTLADALERIEAGETPERLLTYDVVAQRLGISETTARKRGATGEWKEVGHGEVRVPESELNRVIRSMPTRRRRVLKPHRGTEHRREAVGPAEPVMRIRDLIPKRRPAAR
jgi:hypothetical protein